MITPKNSDSTEQCVGSRVGCVPDTRSAVRGAGRSARRSGSRASSRSAAPRWLRDPYSGGCCRRDRDVQRFLEREWPAVDEQPASIALARKLPQFY